MSALLAIAVVAVGFTTSVAGITIASLRFVRKRLEAEERIEKESQPSRDESIPEIAVKEEQIACPYCHSERMKSGECPAAMRIKPYFDKGEFAQAREIPWTFQDGVSRQIRNGTSSVMMLHLERGERLYQACLRCGAEWVFDPSRDDGEKK